MKSPSGSTRCSGGTPESASVLNLMHVLELKARYAECLEVAKAYLARNSAGKVGQGGQWCARSDQVLRTLEQDATILDVSLRKFDGSMSSDGLALPQAHGVATAWVPNEGDPHAVVFESEMDTVVTML